MSTNQDPPSGDPKPPGKANGRLNKAEKEHIEGLVAEVFTAEGRPVPEVHFKKKYRTRDSENPRKTIKKSISSGGVSINRRDLFLNPEFADALLHDPEIGAFRAMLHHEEGHYEWDDPHLSHGASLTPKDLTEEFLLKEHFTREESSEILSGKAEGNVDLALKALRKQPHQNVEHICDLEGVMKVSPEAMVACLADEGGDYLVKQASRHEAIKVKGDRVIIDTHKLAPYAKEAPVPDTFNLVIQKLATDCVSAADPASIEGGKIVVDRAEFTAKLIEQNNIRRDRFSDHESGKTRIGRIYDAMGISAPGDTPAPAAPGSHRHH